MNFIELSRFRKLVFALLAICPVMASAQTDSAQIAENPTTRVTNQTQAALPPCTGNVASKWTNCIGTFAWPDGRKYVGEYSDGKPNGQGTFMWSDGRKYVGLYSDSQPNGQGTFTWPDGRKHVGAYRSGKPNGPGTFLWPDGRKYVGLYKDGKPNGQGAFT